MTKLELMNKMSERLEVKKTEVNSFFVCFVEIIKETLDEEEKIIVPDLGMIQLKYRKSRICKVPKSDKLITIPAQRVPSFKISKRFKLLWKESLKKSLKK